ncbi:Nuclear pore membrane glycoprotein 210 [Chionoecetes opilio]|uniref:Nuclear pore membrane glycoprotein 210 n=1 Tax=Chionoecetes opilio TaxID=41210 RepID=A0A8J4Y8P5_CHIOP|nr:Nuclear pore membrane glycoprotein 210 [Chionoecetes opilio]
MSMWWSGVSGARPHHHRPHRGQHTSASLPHPKKVSATVKVICAVPDSISLLALVRRPTGTRSPCPAMAELGRAVAHCHKPLNLEVVVTDSEQRRFDNISSLALAWEVSNISLAAIPKQELSTLTQTVTAQGHASPIRSKCLG